MFNSINGDLVKQYAFLPIFLITLISLSFARERNRDIVDFRIDYDTTVPLEVKDRLPFKITSIRRDGGERKWNNYVVESSQGELKDSTFIIERYHVLYGDSLAITVRHKRDSSVAHTVNIPLPQITDIRFDRSRCSSKINKNTPSSAVITVTYDNGNSYSVPLVSSGSELTDDAAWSVLKQVNFDFNGVKPGKRGVLWNIEAPETEKAFIKISSLRNPDIFDTLSMKLSFDNHFSFDYDGYDGRSGSDGSGGRSSSCGDGSDGREGRRGGPGGDGADIDLYLCSDTVAGEMVLSALIVTPEGRRRALFSPESGSLKISCSGGRGGDGGEGGYGGNGSNADSTHSRGYGGRGGDGGEGGRGGNGGEVRIYTDSLTAGYVDAVVVVNEGGSGGSGGKPGRDGCDGNDNYEYKTKTGAVFGIIGAVAGAIGGPGSSGNSGYSGESGSSGKTPTVTLISSDQLRLKMK